MAPEKLHNILRKFWAEVKKKREGDDYQPESLKIMQSASERYLKEKNYPLSVVPSREFHNSQEILHVKVISVPQQWKSTTASYQSRPTARSKAPGYGI